MAQSSERRWACEEDIVSGLLRVLRWQLDDSNRVTPAHGDVTPLEILIGVAGYAYPELKTTDWKAGGALGGICKNYEGH